MSRELTSSAVAAIDELYQIVSLQQLHEISLEQAWLSPEQRRALTGLLSTCYLDQVKPCLENKDAEYREILWQAASLNESLEVRNG